MALPKQIGTDNVDFDNDRRVPCYRPNVGQSVDEAAKALGLRCLGRRETGDVVALIKDGGMTFRAVTS